MPTMEAQQKVELMMASYRAIFTAKKESLMEDLTDTAVAIRERWGSWILRINPRLFKDSSTGINDIPGFDITLDLEELNPNGTMRPKSLRFIAQNPNKKDSFGNLKENAILAQAGHRIMWVIDTDVQNGFLGKVMDDQWMPNTPRATYPARNGAPQAIDNTGRNYQRNEGTWIQELPNIDQGNVVNMVEETMSGDEECEFVIDES